MTTIERWKVLSEIFSNFAQPVAAIVVALIAVWGAKDVTDRIVEARGSGATATASPPTGTARSVP